MDYFERMNQRVEQYDAYVKSDEYFERHLQFQLVQAVERLSSPEKAFKIIIGASKILTKERKRSEKQEMKEYYQYVAAGGDQQHFTI